MFLFFSYLESRRPELKNWWIYGLSTLLAGPSFALPLFLYVREDRIH